MKSLVFILLLSAWIPIPRAYSSWSEDNRCKELLEKIEFPKDQALAEEVRVILLWYGEISRLPHISEKEGAVSELIRTIAHKHGLEFFQDEIGNCLIRIPATQGYESEPVLAVQSHIDMVPDAIGNPNSYNSVFASGIFLETDGRRVFSKEHRTSAGLDNGIGVGAMLHLMTKRPYRHPELELLFTVQEEVGMIGAEKLSLPMRARRLINLDGGVGTEVIIGSMGSQRIQVFSQIPSEQVSPSFDQYTLSLSNLPGGHSAEAIHYRRPNSAVIMLYAILAIQERIPGSRLISAEAGNPGMFNKIPKDFRFQIAVPNTISRDLVRKIVTSSIRQDLSFNSQLVSKNARPAKALSKFKWQHARSLVGFSRRYVSMVAHQLLQLKTEVIEYRNGYPKHVFSASNFSFITLAPKTGLTVGIMPRAYLERELQQIIEQEKAKLMALPGNPQLWTGERGGFWQVAPDSQLFNFVRFRFPKLKPEMAQGGIEPAVLLEHFPYLDMLAIGPTIRNAHSTNEYVIVSSIGKMWRVLSAIVSHRTNR